MTRTPTVGLIAILLFSAAAIPAIAQPPTPDPPEDPGPPDCLPQDVVDNDEIRIWFHGMKSKLKLFKMNESSGEVEGSYHYQSMVVNELDEDNNTLATMRLNNAEPQSSTCEIEESGNWTNVTFSTPETVRNAQGGPVGEAVYEFVYHFNHSDDSAKFDLNIQEWPWQDDGEELAYEFDVTSSWEIEPAENGLGFENETTGENEAFIEWAPNATAYYEDGHNETAVVDSETNGTDHHVTTTLQFTQATPGYIELDYDPTIASGPYIIVLDVLIPLTDLPKPVQRLATQIV